MISNRNFRVNMEKTASKEQKLITTELHLSSPINQLIYLRSSYYQVNQNFETLAISLLLVERMISDKRRQFSQ